MNTDNNEKLEKDLQKAVNSIEAPRDVLATLLEQKQKSRLLTFNRLFIDMSTKFYVGVGVALFFLLVAGGLYMQYSGQVPVVDQGKVAEQAGDNNQVVSPTTEQMADDLGSELSVYAEDMADLDAINDKSLDTLDADLNSVISAL